MNKITLFLPLFFSTCSFAQYYQATVPTKFDAFINSPSVEWASYRFDTLRCSNINLAEILRHRFEKNEIKASLPISHSTPEANHLKYSTRKAINNRILQPFVSMQIDSSGNTSQNAIEAKIKDLIDNHTYNIIEPTQILYIEKGKLQSYIPWVAPKISVITSSGVYLGFADYFNTSFNYKYNFKPSPKDIILFLCQTNRMIKTDSVNKADRLKELYGRNLVETLWPYIISGKLDIYSIQPFKKRSPAELNNYMFTNDKIPTPVYDSANSTVLSGDYITPLSPLIFIQVEVAQNWYYDQTANIVYNNIPYIILYCKRLEPGYPEKLTKPVLKIVFK